jgi:uncharacterized GH25 family protein
MKKLTILAVLVMVFSAASFAEETKISETTKFQMTAKSDVKYELVYVSDKSGDVQVTIFDESGRKLSTQTVKKAKNFRRTYDFSQLEPGKYKIVVRNESGSANQQIIHKIKEARLKTFVSKIPNSKSLKLHVGDFDRSSPVRVRIYDQYNELIHSEEINNEQSFSRVYRLQSTQLNYVSVYIENNGETKTFTHELE